MQRKRKPRQFWENIVHEFENTNMTHAQFAQVKGLKLGTFQSWLYKIRQEHLSEEPLFLEVKSLPKAEHSNVSMFLPHDIIVEFSQAPDARFFAALTLELTKLS